MNDSDKTISNPDCSSPSFLICKKQFQNIIDEPNTSSNSSFHTDSRRDSKNTIDFSFKNEDSENIFKSDLNEIEYDNIKTTFNKKISKEKILKEFDEILNNFKEVFSTENKFLLISCLDSLNNLSIKYKFLYVNDIVAKWKKIIINHSKIDNFYFNYNIIEEIMEKMFLEISKQQAYREKTSRNVQKKFISNQKKIISLTQDLFYNGNYYENIINDLTNELENDDEVSLFNKNKRRFSIKSLNFNKFNTNNNSKEIESYEYPFKDDSYFCEIF